MIVRRVLQGELGGSGIGIGANGRDRTDDFLFTKQVLYRLSYVGIECPREHIRLPARLVMRVPAGRENGPEVIGADLPRQAMGTGGGELGEGFVECHR